MLFLGNREIVRPIRYGNDGLVLEVDMNKASEDEFVGTDDSILVERLGHEVAIIQGDYENIKITTAEDLAVAEMLLARKSK